MIDAVVSVLPSWRRCRSRRTMFSTSMIASSTITPNAMTSPASTIVLIDWPVYFKIRPATTRDRGIDRMLISATRHSKRNSNRTMTIRANPINMELLRFCSASSMNVAGRNMVVSISMPGRPGRICARAASTPRVTSIVLPQASFSTINIRPMSPLMMASPFICGCVSRTIVATSPSLTIGLSFGAPGALSIGILASSSGVRLGNMCRTPRRWFGVSINPPVPIS